MPRHRVQVFPEVNGVLIREPGRGRLVRVNHHERCRHDQRRDELSESQRIPTSEQDQCGRNEEENILVADLGEERETGEAAEVVDSSYEGVPLQLCGSCEDCVRGRSQEERDDGQGVGSREQDVERVHGEEERGAGRPELDAGLQAATQRVDQRNRQRAGDAIEENGVLDVSDGELIE